MQKKNRNALPLSSLNHISLLCSSVEISADFYDNVLGFIPIKRPGSFNFDGAWLFNYGIGIHLIEAQNPEDIPKKSEINPKDNHISFQCEDIQQVEDKLRDLGVKYLKRLVEEGGIMVDQLFFHDPDGFMIEVCNCDNLPVIPIEAPAVCLRPAAPRGLKRTVSSLAFNLSESISQNRLAVSAQRGMEECATFG